MIFENESFIRIQKNREGKYGKSEGKFIGPLHVYNTAIPRLNEKYGCSLKEKHLEADDIIALVKKYLLEKIRIIHL